MYYPEFEEQIVEYVGARAPRCREQRPDLSRPLLYHSVLLTFVEFRKTYQHDRVL